MTITEFLLARIAEDEASANNWLRFEIRDGRPGNYAIPDRVLAECEAKRRIVEHLRETVEDDCENSGMIAFAEQPLRLLALPYADHLDYDQAWRPL